MEIKKLHREAIELAKKAFEARDKNNFMEFSRYLEDALEIEKKAASELENDFQAEPTRSVIFLTAANLAYSIKKYDEAKILLNTALKGSPYSEMKIEIQNLFDKIDSANKTSKITIQKNKKLINSSKIDLAQKEIEVADSKDFKTLRKSILNLLSGIEENMVPVVSYQDQQRELKLLKETITNERFFFVVDMLNFEITECHGVNKWLGYNEENFTLKFYLDKLLHPSIKKSLLIVIQQMYRLLCSGTFELHFIVQRFTGMVALKHQRGHYLLIKKASSIFQYDTHNRMLSYIDEFTIIGELDEQRLQELVFGGRLANVTGASMEAQQKKIIERTMAHFMEMKIFSPTEIQVVRKIAYHKGITRKELAAEFKVSIHTINTFHKRILEKIRNFFHKDFTTVEESANFLRQEGFL